MWLAVALCSPILWAASTHMDKYLVARYFERYDVAVLLVFTALVGLLMLPFIAVAHPALFRMPHGEIVLLLSTGMAYMLAMYFYLVALTKEEASVVAPLFQGSIIVAYVLGYVILHETPTWAQLIATALILGGTAFVSIDPRAAERRFNVRLVALMSACALVLGASTVVFKAFAFHGAFWPTTFWTYAGEAIYGFGVLLVPKYRRQFAELIKRSTRPLMAINGINELVNLAGGVIARYALLLAPAGLVQAVTSTTTIFVFLIGIGLSVCCPSIARERLDRSRLVRKGLATVAVTAGVVIAGLA